MIFIFLSSELYIKENNTCDPVHLDNTSISSLNFADDLVILSESQAGLQNSLNKLEKYCYKWQLAVNTNQLGHVKILTSIFSKRRMLLVLF
jgi:hypothetical protein